MYKVFFNYRTIYLMDKMPDIAGTEKAYVCTFLQKEDLEPQLRNYLIPDKEGDLYIFSAGTKDPFDIFRSCFKNISAAGGLVKNLRNEYLVIFRRGKWDLPKGKAEKSESSEETALREVEEECSLKDLSIEKFLTTTYHIYYQDGRAVLKQTDWYLMEYPGTKEPVPETREDIEKTIWMKPARVKEITGNTYLSILDVFSTEILA